MTTRPRWLERLGQPHHESERCIWLIGDSRHAFEAAAPAIRALQERQARVHVLLSSGEPTLLPWLASRFPDCRAIAMPLGVGFVIGEYLHWSDIRLAAFVGGSRAATPALLNGLARRAVPAVILDHGDLEGWPPSDALRRAAETRLRIDTKGFVDTAVSRFVEMLGRDQKRQRGRGGWRHWLLDLVCRSGWRERLAWRVRRYDDLAALAAALGRPRTVMCLGNGPSSEDPALAALAHDCLFRVNHSWLARGYLAAPDVVFAGGRPSFKAVRRAIFGLQSEDAEARLVSSRLFDPRMGPTRFFSAHEVAPALDAFEWGHLRPTNGATMMATAVALEPARLIVAGIDLFQHPQGSYPGNAETPNAYSPAHSRDSELEFLLRLFRDYEGELVIVGDILAGEWQRYRAEIDR